MTQNMERNPSAMESASSPVPSQSFDRSIRTRTVPLASPINQPGISYASPSNHSSFSSRSATSTLVFGHEPFERFKKRVQTLCEALRPPQRWPKTSIRQKFFASRIGHRLSETKILARVFRHWAPTRTDFKIERLRGGSYNRVVGITLPEPHGVSLPIQSQYILRVPRDEDARPDREVATLEHVRHRTNIPVPKIIAKDYCCNNALKLPYIIQERIPGKDLQMVWHVLTHEQRCIVARELAKTLLELQALTSPVPGLIEADREAFDGSRCTTIVPYELKSDLGFVKEPKSNEHYGQKVVSTLDFLVHQMSRWRAVEIEKSGGDMHSPAVTLWTSLIHATKDMHRLGLFKNDTFCLCHLDLQPRNIMAEVQQHPSIAVTGYLDWDSAVFAPKFVGCAPPRWLWFDGETEYNEEDERGAIDLPLDPQMREVKRVFEETVGPDYLHYAYAPQYPLARMLFRIAKNGIWSSERLDDVERFMPEWAKLRTLLVHRKFQRQEGTRRGSK